jgi:hypothetical protein
MNYLQKIFLKNINKQTYKSFYSTILKTKFRRAIQPGLTRYNYDEYDHQTGSMEVFLFKLVFKVVTQIKRRGADQ